MKQLKENYTYEQLSTNEMALLKGGHSSGKNSDGVLKLF